MTSRDMRLVPIAGGIWATALVCVHLPHAAVAVCVGLALLAAFVRALPSRGRGVHRLGGLAGVVLAALLLSAASAVTVAFAQPSREAALEQNGHVVEMYAEVMSSPNQGRDGRFWFDAQGSLPPSPTGAHQGDISVRVGVAVPSTDGAADSSRAPEDLALGAVVRVVGVAKAADAGERASLIIFGEGPVEIVAPPGGVFAIAADVRADFVDRATRLPEPGAGLLPGLAVGDTSAVSDELDAAMLASGLSHLTAVSGANCAIVVGGVFWVFALCGAGRTLRVIGGLVALCAFVVLVTPEPSVVRAATMSGIGMLTLLCGRPGAGVSVLALAVSIILIGDPWLSMSPGFALSAAATGALLLLAPVLARGFERWMPLPIALALAVPLAAQIVCTPIIALFAEQHSLVSVLANIVAAPAAPVATVIGLLACLAAPLSLLADLFAATAWLPSAWIAVTADVSSSLPGAEMAAPSGIPTAILLAGAGAAVAVVLGRGRGGARAARPWRLVAGGVLILGVAIGGSHVLLDGPLARAIAPGDWSVVMCDVGQGDAILVRSAGVVALIDTGPDPQALAGCLTMFGVERIDLLVLTHFDLDHVGGVDAVVGRVGTTLHGPLHDATDQRVLQDLQHGGSTVSAAAAGQSGTLGDASWRVVWPRDGSGAFEAGNDTSVVWEITGGGVPRTLFLGDLSASAQRALSASGGLSLPYPVVKVAHHGSGDQDSALYADVKPMVALFSAGADNDYGHPRAETLALVETAGATAFRTDEQGAIAVIMEDGDMTVWTQHARRPRDVDVDDAE
ncbi:MAG: ComEC/Rec2 family competence protein [Actinomycetota bacterium]